MAECHLKSIKFPHTPWRIIHTIANTKDGTPRKKTYEAKVAEIQLSSHFKTHICFGQAAQTPFGTISDKQKYVLGQKLLTCF